MDIFGNAATETPKHVKQIVETYMNCYASKLANETIVSEILKGELKWSKPIPNGNDIQEDEFWAIFIKKIILNINLFGYAVYRYIPKPVRTGTTFAEVADPSSHAFVQSEGNWTLQSTKTTEGKRLKGSRMWKTTMMNAPEPLLNGGQDQMEFTSAGWRSMTDALNILSLEENIHKRDTYNSCPTVYTEISSRIGESGLNRPWFGGASAGRQTAASFVPRDFNTVVEERAETIARLDELTDEQRQRARDKSMSLHQLGRGGAPMEEERDHRELIVSDGRHAEPVPHLRAPEDVYRLISRLEHRIMFCYGVPPQTVGENINSERNAASSRLADVSLQIFETTCNRIRTHVNKALKDVSMLLTGDKDTYLYTVPCVSMFSLSRIEGLITKEAFVRLYSCAYNISVDDINEEAVEIRQRTINEAQASTTRVENTIAGAGKTKNRPTMTAAQKSFRDAQTAEKPAE